MTASIQNEALEQHEELQRREAEEQEKKVLTVQRFQRGRAARLMLRRRKEKENENEPKTASQVEADIVLYELVGDVDIGWTSHIYTTRCNLCGVDITKQPEDLFKDLAARRNSSHQSQVEYFDPVQITVAVGELEFGHKFAYSPFITPGHFSFRCRK